MKFETKARYPVSSDIVLKMFSDPSFHTKKLVAMGLTRHKVLEQKADGAEFRIKIERKVPLDAPGMLKKFFPADTTVVSEERWNKTAKTGKVRVEPAGVPVDMTCQATLADAGGECVVTYVWDVKARVPLVGGALEKFVCSDMEKRMGEESRAGAALAKDYR